jgi:hypothetical protein
MPGDLAFNRLIAGQRGSIDHSSKHQLQDNRIVKKHLFGQKGPGYSALLLAGAIFFFNSVEQLSCLPQMPCFMAASQGQPFLSRKIPKVRMRKRMRS